jgi:hypothetical protein
MLASLSVTASPSCGPTDSARVCTRSRGRIAIGSAIGSRSPPRVTRPVVRRGRRSGRQWLVYRSGISTGLGPGRPEPATTPCPDRRPRTPGSAAASGIRTGPPGRRAVREFRLPVDPPVRGAPNVVRPHPGSAAPALPNALHAAGARPGGRSSRAWPAVDRGGAFPHPGGGGDARKAEPACRAAPARRVQRFPQRLGAAERKPFTSSQCMKASNQRLLVRSGFPRPNPWPPFW